MASKQVTVPAQLPAQSSNGFSGKSVTVEFMKIKDNEPTDIFVGVNEYQARIKRGAVVTIPLEAFEVLERATYFDMEEDPENPDNKIQVEKRRYPFNVHSRNYDPETGELHKAAA